MHIGIVNESADEAITMPLMQQIACALQRQLVEHWAPAWERLPPEVVVYPGESDVPADSALVVVIDNPDQAGALGYHTVTPMGGIYSPIFWHPIRDNGGTLTVGSLSLSVTLSHEVLELSGDPYCVFMADMDDGSEEWMEACDRVEGDSYDIDGIAVSNFLTLRAFRDGSGPWDYMHKLLFRDGLTPGGYVTKRIGGPTGQVTQVFGDKMPGWKKNQKSMPHQASRAARRLA